MQKYIDGVKCFLAEEDGPTAVEYAVMLALIVVVCVGAGGQLGSAVSNRFTQTATEINATN